MTEAPRTPEEPGPGPGTVVVVGPDGRPVGTVDTDAQADGEDPSRLIRIGAVGEAAQILLGHALRIRLMAEAIMRLE